MTAAIIANCDGRAYWKQADSTGAINQIRTDETWADTRKRHAHVKREPG